MTRITHRRICWPDPDATCLHGGCQYCNEHPFRPLGQIASYARSAGTLYHRGGGRQGAWEAYCTGLDNQFYNAQTKRRTDGPPAQDRGRPAG